MSLVTGIMSFYSDLSFLTLIFHASHGDLILNLPFFRTPLRKVQSINIWGRNTYSDPNSFKWLKLSLFEFNLDIDICTAGERIEHR